MFAVIRTGGKQYKVAQGDVLKVELLPGDAGSAVTFSEVLMAGDKLGAVDHLMIDKFTGHVEYAVMSFGGFLGIGESYNPLP